MNSVTSRVTLLTAVMGLSLGAAIAASNVNAAGDILNDAIHAYSDDAWSSNEVITTNEGNVYHTRNLLNDAAHDYVSEDVELFINSNPSGEMERSEFAAFEESNTPIPWEISSKMAW